MTRPEFRLEDRRAFMKSAASQCLGVSFAGAVGSQGFFGEEAIACLLYTSPSPRDQRGARMPSSA